eukprot:4392764-Amphidinium_carterae.1
MSRGRERANMWIASNTSERLKVACVIPWPRCVKPPSTRPNVGAPACWVRLVLWVHLGKVQ